MKKIFVRCAAPLIAAVMLGSVGAAAAEAPVSAKLDAAPVLIVPAPGTDLTVRPYEHDPRLNPTAMADIVYDPAAVYGFRPNPESARLGSYAVYDWTDPEIVETAHLSRIEYHESMRELYDLEEKLAGEGKDIETIARAVSALRNEVRLRVYADNPEGLASAKASNLAAYGNENGPTADSLYEKYGSWETVLEKAFSTNSGMDAVCGLYDDYYDLYVLLGQVGDAAETETEAFMKKIFLLLIR